MRVRYRACVLCLGGRLITKWTSAVGAQVKAYFSQLGHIENNARVRTAMVAVDVHPGSIGAR